MRVAALCRLEGQTHKEGLWHTAPAAGGPLSGPTQSWNAALGAPEVPCAACVFWGDRACVV